MSSKTIVANRTLQKLGATTITSLEDGTRNSKVLKVMIDEILLQELQAHPWSFSIERASLAADATAPAWGRLYSYTLPADYLRLIAPYVEMNNIYRDWVIESKKILTNDSAPLYIRYIKAITDVSQMSPLFRDAWAARMAIESCELITQSNSKKESLKEDYKDIIARAKKANAIEQVPIIAPVSEWTQERY